MLIMIAYRSYGRALRSRATLCTSPLSLALREARDRVQLSFRRRGITKTMEIRRIATVRLILTVFYPQYYPL